MSKRKTSKGLTVKQAKNTTFRMATISQSFMGPIPDASQLEKYDLICPGAADRIIAMTEKQSAHRQQIEKKVVDTNSRNSTLGVIFAFVLGLVTIGGGVYLVLCGSEWPGAILGSAGLIGLVSVFIYGTRSGKQERIDKS